MVTITFLSVDEPVKYMSNVGTVTEVVERFKSKFGDVKIVDVEETK